MNKILFPKITLFLLLIIPLTFFGFNPTYFSKLSSTDFLYHAHAGTMMLWVVLAIVQPFLIHSKKTNFQAVSNTSYVLPTGGAPVYLEFDYKCNHTFTVGIYGHTKTSSSIIPLLGVNPTNTWNKMYAYLTPGVSSISNATDFSIYFAMFNDEGADGVELLIDNVKLIY